MAKQISLYKVFRYLILQRNTIDNEMIYTKCGPTVNIL